MSTPEATDKPSPEVLCQALFLTAPSSGQGKTTITAALAQLLRQRGKTVVVFKTGPDYLDPQILAQASGNPVAPLDLWMAGEQWCQRRLYEAAQTADIILIEGAMGMFDGEPSSADLAARFNIPLAIVMDVKGMAQTAAAIAVGLAHYRRDIHVVGLLANNCSTERHRELIEQALPEDLPLLATLKRSSDVALPERHLGLVQPSEIQEQLNQRLEAGAQWLEEANILPSIERLSPVSFVPPKGDCAAESFAESDMACSVGERLKDRTIAIAKDAAFSFIYAENVSILQKMGAKCVFFSPLFDEALPEADAIWLPGGYPELYAAELAANDIMKKHIRHFWQQDKPILAECGGFLYCLETLLDLEGECFDMAGILPGQASMRGKRGCQGMQAAPLPEGVVRGHAHHRSRASGTPEPIAYGQRQRHSAPGEAIYRQGSLTATYLHLFFPSNPLSVARLFAGQAVESTTQKSAVSKELESKQLEPKQKGALL